jgi:MFS family permease
MARSGLVPFRCDVMSEAPTPSQIRQDARPSLLAPLALPAFRAIWAANIVSNIGTLMQSVGAAWLMTTLTPSTTLVGLVQTAATLPVFLIGLVAGALADLADRRVLLFWSQAWMLLMAASLGVLTLLGHATPWVLLVLTFGLGFGWAISLPAWQATVQDMVPKAWVAPAVALNSISFNVARAIGPALGGFVVAAFGAAFAFFANAASFLAVLAAVVFWKKPPAEASRLSEDVVGAIRAGFRYLLHAPRLQAPIVRAVAFNLCAATVWPLLPLFARDVLKTSASGYGLLLGAFGLGSIVSAMAVPRLRGRFALDRILALGAVLGGMAFLGLSISTQPLIAGVLLFFSGAAWVGVLVNFNVAVQTSVPDWVRGRALAFYLLAFQGVLAFDGALWGWLAGIIGTPQCFAAAGAGLVAGLVLIRFFPLVIDETIDLTPSTHWPEAHANLQADLDDGPVLVSIEYLIAPENFERFRLIMRQLRERRLRDGARRWRLYQDAQQPGRFLELFRLDSWGEHLRQHERTTVADKELEAIALKLHQGPARPKVTHYFGLEE